jgi:alanine dehydrogenase
VPAEHLSLMKPGAVIVDVGVDQGGCVETIRPTTHADPTYIVEGVVHYGVTNMPGAVGRTSTFGLTNATMPYLFALADEGYQKACAADSGLGEGINCELGKLTNRAVAEAFHMQYEPSSVARGNGC